MNINWANVFSWMTLLKCFVVGGIMTLIALFGHQNDIKIQSLIVLFAGLVIGVIPSLATWIMS